MSLPSTGDFRGETKGMCGRDLEAKDTLERLRPRGNEKNAIVFARL